MNDITLTLTLTVNEINALLAGLQELPGKICNPLSQKIQQQAQPQIAELQKGEEETLAQAVQ